MVNISFDYNPETRSVTNMKVTDLAVSSLAKKRVKSKVADNVIVVTGGSMKLTQDAMDLLGVSVGDRLCVRFNNGPILATPTSLGETGGGNLITKSLTVTCRGKAAETIATYGSRFTYTCNHVGMLDLKADIATEIAQVAEQEALKSVEIKSVLGDSDFALPVKGGEEIDFDFAI
jgi:hypothetical protein